LRRLQVWLPATSDSTRVTCLTFWCPRLDAAVRWDFLIGWPREKTAVFYADEPSPHIRHGTVPLKLRSGWTVGTFVVMNTDEALGCAVCRCDVLSQLTSHERFCRFRSKRPSPTPFLSMNSMPARCKAVWIAFTASSETNLRSFSKSTTVDRPNLAARASRDWVMPRRARAARHWAGVIE
jgi:hypothetical protein